MKRQWQEFWVAQQSTFIIKQHTPRDPAVVVELSNICCWYISVFLCTFTRFPEFRLPDGKKIEVLSQYHRKRKLNRLEATNMLQRFSLGTLTRVTWNISCFLIRLNILWDIDSSKTKSCKTETHIYPSSFPSTCIKNLISKTTFIIRSMMNNYYSPTRARITVSRDAIGNDTVTLNSSICKRSTETHTKYSMTFFSTSKQKLVFHLYEKNFGLTKNMMNEGKKGLVQSVVFFDQTLKKVIWQKTPKNSVVRLKLDPTERGKNLFQLIWCSHIVSCQKPLFVAK